MWANLERYDRIFSPFRPDSELNTVRSSWSVRGAGGDPGPLGARAARHRWGLRHPRRRHLDPSGIVKGWAAQRAARSLEHLGVDYYLNAGGDLTVTPVDPRDPWRIGIEHPADATRLLTVIDVRTGAVATSGSAHRGTHLWDPESGQPSRSLWQATVVGPELMWADVLATAAVVAGPDRLDRTGWPPGYEVLFASPDGRLRATRQFGKVSTSESFSS